MPAAYAHYRFGQQALAALSPELQKTVTPELNDRLIGYMCARGIEYGFWQEPESGTGDMIPAFDLTGV